MSKFKKIFIILACVISALTASFLITVCSVKSNVGIAIGNPYSIVVFNQSTTGREVKNEETISEFNKQMNNVTNLTVFDKLVNGVTIKNRIYQDSSGKFAKWSTDLLNKNLVIEVIYNKMQDLIVYDGDDTRVVSYYCISFVIPKTDDFTEIAVYYSITSNADNNEKNDSYRENTPLILYGNASDFIEFAKTISN